MISGFRTIYYEKVSLENYSQKLDSATFYEFLKKTSEYEEIIGKPIHFVFLKTFTQADNAITKSNSQGLPEM